MTSIRHDRDAWDPASSVGATATMAAMSRAIASRGEHALINDPFAEPLVRAVGVDLLARLASGDMSPSDLVERVWIDGAAVRTKFYDEFFLDATDAGITQVVILAAGLDSRAYRLPWPAGTVVYEVDHPGVVDFKDRALARLKALPTADRRTTPIDLRDDWPAALFTAGFDPGRPTAWSAEGLLGYLPPDAQDRLLDSITELSTPASRVATESRRNSQSGQEGRTKDGLRRVSEKWRAYGFDLDHTRLRYFGERNEAGPYLIDRGWTLRRISARELFAANGLPPLKLDEMRTGDVSYVSGAYDSASRSASRSISPSSGSASSSNERHWPEAASVEEPTPLSGTSRPSHA